MAEKSYRKFKKHETDGEKSKRLAKLRKIVKRNRRVAHLRSVGKVP